MKSGGWLFLVLIVACCSSKKDYRPESHLSLQVQDKVMMAIIRYVGKAPENVGNEKKFDRKHDAYYQQLAGRHHLDEYFIDDDGVHYFLISRAAPSLFEKRVATGGKMKFDPDWKLIEYEEVFRTWKMNEEDLQRKGAILFEAMVNGQSLIPYQTPNATEEFIEFPDPRTYYDKETRTWKTKNDI